jgi:hypothetical protein
VEENVGVTGSRREATTCGFRGGMVLTGRRLIEEEPGVRAEAGRHRGGGVSYLVFISKSSTHRIHDT